MAILKIGEDFKIPEPAEISLSRKALGQVLNRRPFGKEGMSPDRNLVYTFREEPFVEAGDWKYWLESQLKFFLIKGEARFHSVSLIVSRSALVVEAERKKVLRAEWERFEDPDPRHREHAQPHWHVYSSELENSAVSRSIERFHLAMATGWHLGETGSHYREPSPENVAGWIRQCVTYTRGQLLAISRNR